jgi:hypothetical protein
VGVSNTHVAHELKTLPLHSSRRLNQDFETRRYAALTKMITGLAHVNLIIPQGSLPQANAFYGDTLGLTPRPVPQLQKDRLAWFDIGTSGQQVHIAFGPKEPESSRHPCFKIESPEKLLELQKRVYAHFEKGDEAAPRAADKPGEENSGMLIRVLDAS